MTINISISNRVAYSFLALFVILIVGGFAIAQNTFSGYQQDVPNPGHGADTVWVSTDQGEMTLQEAITNQVIGGNGIVTYEECEWVTSDEFDGPVQEDGDYLVWPSGTADYSPHLTSVATCPTGKVVAGYKCGSEDGMCNSGYDGAPMTIEVTPEKVTCELQFCAGGDRLRKSQAYCCVPRVKPTGNSTNVSASGVTNSNGNQLTSSSVPSGEVTALTTAQNTRGCEWKQATDYQQTEAYDSGNVRFQNWKGEQWLGVFGSPAELGFSTVVSCSGNKVVEAHQCEWSYDSLQAGAVPKKVEIAGGRSVTCGVSGFDTSNGAGIGLLPDNLIKPARALCCNP